MAWGGAQGSSAQKHSVRARPEQAHEEAVSAVAAADGGPRGRALAQRHDAVERRHEVRVHDAVFEPKLAVNPLEVLRQGVPRELALVEDLERIDQWSPWLL